MKRLLVLSLISFQLQAMQPDLEAGQQISPHTQQVTQRLNQLRDLIATTPPHQPDQRDALMETITAIEHSIIEALIGNNPAAQGAQQAVGRIQNPVIKLVVGGVIAAVLVVANQWLSCSVKK